MNIFLEIQIPCGGSGILKIIYFVKELLKVITILVPIILLVMLSIDFGKSVIASGVDSMKKNFTLALKRVVVAIAFFLVPSLVRGAMTLFGDMGISYLNCLNKEATLENISLYEEEEKLNLENRTANDSAPTVDTTVGSGVIASHSSTSYGSKPSNDKDTSSYQTKTDLSKIENCDENKVLRTLTTKNSKKVKLYECVDEFTLRYVNNGKGKVPMQNFAITKKYLYFSYAGRGAWVKTNQTYQKLGHEGTLKQVSATYILRVTRSNQNYQIAYLEYAGHAQSFDVTENDELYLNHFAYTYKGSLGYGGSYHGVAHAYFNSNDKVGGVEMIPDVSIALAKNGKSLTLVKSSDYYRDGKLEKDTYHSRIKKIGSDSSYAANPEVAVDEEHNQIALSSKGKVNVYRLDKFLLGDVSLISSFSIPSGYQGLELYQNYLYVFDGNRSFILKKYNIQTKKMEDSVSFSVKNGGESEGMSIYNGKIYLGIPTTNRKNSLYLIKGF